MQLIFDGATETVTGSCTLLQYNNKNILIDCGLYQGYGVEDYNARNLIYDPKKIDYILLTHAHIDHSGKIPYLVKKGFKGKVICTKPTKDLCDIILPDSGYIQQKKMKWDMPAKKKKKLLYNMDEAVKSLKYFSTIQYNKKIELEKGLYIRFKNSGHMLGSAFIEIFVQEEDRKVKLLFTGDIGNDNNRILKDYEKIKEADVIVIESTYGDREHEKEVGIKEQIKQSIIDVVNKNGKLIIPSFAVGRAQEMLMYIKDLYKNIDNKYKIPIYIDSPLTVQAFKKFKDNDEYLTIKSKDLESEYVRFVESIEESKNISNTDDSIIIISASGMADYGRVKEHIKNNVSNDKNIILFGGYLAEGSLGRKLKKGNKNIKIDGIKYRVKADIKKINGLSGHVDKNGLIQFLDNIQTLDKTIYINHGTDASKETFKNEIIKNIEGDTTVIVPKRELEYKIKLQKVKHNKYNNIYKKVYVDKNKFIYNI